ncbi:SAM-dependent methyltransferase [Actinomycetospora termitidis]|uniref:SAM-dependent methyltransferase n=1 Tax=Actinomycetospora termitidis TaxID=3053470 RepID=A0ABT7MEN4_9PSEU|nr:SAM-dependent methyltransferase [Actinomycetospora sp. Odt1-22]MDL5159124.1 SAM-dependent methyltransferase [Actinomycetospora sp. Odt1-22]
MSDTGDITDVSEANAARIYDHFLGGAHNFAADRAVAAVLLERHPDVAEIARANRDFLGHTVRWCLAQGIMQFLDLGSGIPTVGNVHEIVGAHARVAYVDAEPVAVAYARDILVDVEHASITHADLCDVDAVLAAPGVRTLLDLTEPVAVLAVAVLHSVGEDPRTVVDAYRAHLAPGSAIVLSHGSDDQDDPAVATRIRDIRDAMAGSASPLTPRSRAEIRGFLHGLEPVAPGLVDVADWPTPGRRPRSGIYGLVAQLPPVE